jgi:hypothetical protein
MASFSDNTGTARSLLRHAVATLGYRADKVLRDVPPGFAEQRASASSRAAVEIVSHLGDLMEWAERMARGEYKWAPQPSADWRASCDRFFGALKALDTALVEAPLDAYPADVIFQGPVADALTHIGQLALMRGIAGIPIKPESYARAEIVTGRVGRDQSATRKEFEGDASWPNKPAEKKDEVDEASEESFPASDPPSQTPTAGATPKPTGS